MKAVYLEHPTIEQVRWGSNDDPSELLTIGECYEVERLEIHTWHTKVHLKGIAGKFNSVSFDLIPEGEKETP